MKKFINDRDEDTSYIQWDVDLNEGYLQCGFNIYDGLESVNFGALLFDKGKDKHIKEHISDMEELRAQLTTYLYELDGKLQDAKTKESA